MKYTEMTNDAVFLPGTVHGCEDEIYIIYFNEDSNDGKGSFEIEICDKYTLKKLLDKTDNADEFFELLPDYFQGEWRYVNHGTELFNGYAEDYERADFVFGRDGGLKEEYEFVKKWVESTMKAE